MPRHIPRFDLHLSAQVSLATGVVIAGEIARVIGGELVKAQWTLLKLEALYELAYLRAFSAWENCLESVFLRSLCGYASSAGQETLHVGTYYPSLATAEAAALAGQAFMLWHNPHKVITRCQHHITSGPPHCPALLETMISSNSTRLEHLAAVRHRIVHDQRDAKNNFDAASLLFAGRVYPASRPGKFLRDWDTSVTPPRRWLDTTTSELVSLAGQIV